MNFEQVERLLQTKQQKDVAKLLGVHIDTLYKFVASHGTSSQMIKYEFRKKFILENLDFTAEELARCLNIGKRTVVRLRARIAPQRVRK